MLAGQSLVHTAYGAEFAAHTAGIAMIVLWQSVVTNSACSLWINSTGELRLPVQGAAGVRHLIIDVSGSRNSLRNISRMSRDL